MLDKKIRKQIRNILEKEQDIIAAYHFGSFSENNSNGESDFDIAIVVANKKQVSEKKIYSLLKNVEFPKNLDITIVNKQSSPLLLYEIISHGELIFFENEDSRIIFESFVLKNYYDTAHIRNIYFNYLPQKYAY
jgi:predicted nucleotidyltransferase